jgi:hypothetical protein
MARSTFGVSREVKTVQRMRQRNTLHGRVKPGYWQQQTWLVTTCRLRVPVQSHVDPILTDCQAAQSR